MKVPNPRSMLARNVNPNGLRWIALALAAAALTYLGLSEQSQPQGNGAHRLRAAESTIRRICARSPNPNVCRWEAQHCMLDAGDRHTSANRCARKGLQLVSTVH